MTCGVPETGASLDSGDIERWVEILGAVFESYGSFIVGMQTGEEVVRWVHGWSFEIDGLRIGEQGVGCGRS